MMFFALQVYKEAKDQGFFVKDRDNNDFEGHCWPGASSYLDFLNPQVRNYWINKFNFDQYQGSTDALYTWNDMNEPSVFSGPEVPIVGRYQNLDKFDVLTYCKPTVRSLRLKNHIFTTYVRISWNLFPFWLLGDDA